jgi:hypothetical protein
MQMHQTEAAVAGHLRAGALRATDDPDSLRRAARIRAARARDLISLDELDSDNVRPGDLANIKEATVDATEVAT